LTAMTEQAMQTIWLKDEGATCAFAAGLAQICAAGDIIALSGELGAGKTVFARAFIAALGGTGEVPSPTFTLAQEYELASVRVYHFDLYRIEAPEDAYELGIEDAFEDGICLIEWPENLASILPNRRLLIRLAFDEGETQRRAEIDAPAMWLGRLEGAAWYV